GRLGEAAGAGGPPVRGRAPAPAGGLVPAGDAGGGRPVVLRHLDGRSADRPARRPAGAGGGRKEPGAGQAPLAPASATATAGGGGARDAVPDTVLSAGRPAPRPPPLFSRGVAACQTCPSVPPSAAPRSRSRLSKPAPPPPSPPASTRQPGSSRCPATTPTTRC